MNVVDYIAIILGISAFAFVTIVIGIIITDYRKSNEPRQNGNDTLP
jgi:glucose uptake protein GlcU